MEVQAAEDPTDEPELEVLDDNAVKLDTSNVPIMLSVSQVHEFAMSYPLTQSKYCQGPRPWGGIMSMCACNIFLGLFCGIRVKSYTST